MKVRSRDLSDAKLVPPQPLSCDNGHGDHAHSPSDRGPDILPLAVATETGRYSRFTLPDDGWITILVPRRNSSTIDKYYYEEGSGTLFRSLKEVERYIKAGEYPSKSSAKIIRSCLKVIEDIPQRSGGGSYKHYYEPGTGRKFRYHLEEEIPLSAYIEEIKENAPLSKAFKLHRKLKNVSRKRNLTTSSNGDGHTSTSSYVSPPKKIKWILGSTGGDVWYPFIFETPVQDSVKQEWNERFTVVMKDDDNQHQSNEIS